MTILQKCMTHIVLLGMLLMAVIAWGQDLPPLAKSVSEVKTLHPVNDLLTPSVETAQRVAISRQVRDAQYFRYNGEVAQRLLGSPSAEGLSVNLPSVGRSKQKMTLDLVEVPASFYDYVVVTSSGGRYYGDATKGRHYRGVVRGKENESLVALSLYEGEMMGVVSVDGGNLNIGKLQGEDAHILYNDQDLASPPSFACDTPDDPSLPGYDREMLLGSHRSATSTSGKCVRLYYETEYDIYQNKGSVANVESYIMGLHNQVATLYTNEQIETRVSELKIWNTSDPYTATSTGSLLSQFKGQISSMNGNLGQLLTFRSVGGGRAAGFSGICNSNVDNSLSVSGIYSTYANFPTYSWSVMVVTHEFGHLFGSRHTHACVWNGNNTAIDGCAGFTEGSCSRPGYPSGGGTIMSYCHQRSVGINFSKGFGPQPGNVIRNRVANGDCLGDCGDPCPDDLAVTHDVPASSTDTQQANNTLTATNTIFGNATYSAGTRVVLAAGFYVVQGSYFRGHIEGCTPEGTRTATEPIAAVGSVGTEDVGTEALTSKAEAIPQGFAAFPNPTQGQIRLSYAFVAERQYTVTVHDIIGRPLLRREVSVQDNVIDLKGLTPGLYLLRFSDTEKEEVYMRKVVLE